MSFLKNLHLILIPMAIMGAIIGAIMGLMPGLSITQAESRPLITNNTVTHNTSRRPVVNLREKTDDPADGFTGRGSPNRRSSGGSRGDCSGLLVALVPGDEPLAVSDAGCNLASSSELALTTAAMPVLWFHIPPQASPVEGELALLDDSQFALGIQTIALPQAGGIVGIQVDTELELDRTYSWVFSLLETPQKPSNNPWVAGLLRRTRPSTETVLAIDAAESPQAQAEIWLEQGIWHNALTILASLKLDSLKLDSWQHSDETLPAIEQQWQTLLNASGLGLIADAPVQNCCQ